MGIIIFIDGNRDPVRRIGNLRYCIDDQAIVLLPVVGGHYIQAVSDLKQSGQVIFVGCFILLCQIVAAEFFGQGLKLCVAVVVQGRLDLDSRICKGQFLAAFQHFLHGFCGHGRPGAVFDQAHDTVLEIPFRQMIDKFTHKRENICVISGRGKNQFPIAECVLHCLCHILARQVCDNHLWAPFCGQLCGQGFYGFLCISINRGIGDQDAFCLYGIGGPCIVEPQIVSKVFFQYRAVQRADGLDIQPGCFFQEALDLGAVFPDDSDIVTARFACPVLFHIKGTEFPESVRGEQNLIIAVICHNDFRPVNHGGCHKGKFMLSERKGISFFYNNLPVFKIGAEKLLHHGKCFDG